jgi:hypothetical protein
MFMTPPVLTAAQLAAQLLLLKPRFMPAAGAAAAEDGGLLKLPPAFPIPPGTWLALAQLRPVTQLLLLGDCRLLRRRSLLVLW